MKFGPSTSCRLQYVCTVTQNSDMTSNQVSSVVTSNPKPVSSYVSSNNIKTIDIEFTFIVINNSLPRTKG